MDNNLKREGIWFEKIPAITDNSLMQTGQNSGPTNKKTFPRVFGQQPVETLLADKRKEKPH